MKAGRGVLSRQASTRIGDTGISHARATDVETLQTDSFGYEDDNFVGQGEAVDSHKVSKIEVVPDARPRQKQNKSNARLQSRGLLEEPSGFHRTNRGITVRTDEEYPKLKTAELKISYALILLEQDMGYYRHLVKEATSKSEKYGPQRFYLGEDTKTEIPGLWLKDPTTVYGRISKPPPVELFVEEMLSTMPNLWAGFEEQRKKDIARITWIRQKPLKEQSTVTDKPATPSPQLKNALLGSEASGSAGIPASSKSALGKTSPPGKGPPTKPLPGQGLPAKQLPVKGPLPKPLPK